MLFEERDYPIIEHVGRGDRVLAIIEFDESELAVGINEGLLVDAAHAFDHTHVVGVLCTQVTWMLGLDLPVGFLLLTCPFQGLHLIFGQNDALLRDFGR